MVKWPGAYICPLYPAAPYPLPEPRADSMKIFVNSKNTFTVRFQSGKIIANTMYDYSYMMHKYLKRTGSC